MQDFQNGEQKHMPHKTGDKMVLNRLGRFSIETPADWESVAQSYEVRFCEIKELLWPTHQHRDQARELEWNSRILEIEKLTPPDDIDKVIIESKRINVSEISLRGVFYYSDYLTSRRICLDVLLDEESIGVWFRKTGRRDLKEGILNLVVEIAKAYRSPIALQGSAISGAKMFYLKYGALALPYDNQEKIYMRSENQSSDLIFEIKIQSTHQVEKHSLLEKLGAALAMNFAPGVKIDKLRTTSKTIADLKGDELILRGNEDGSRQLSFSWSYSGREDSGDFPEILITLESPDEKVEEKIKIWDDILASMKRL